MVRLTLITVFVISLIVGWFGSIDAARAQTPCGALVDPGDGASTPVVSVF